MARPVGRSSWPIWANFPVHLSGVDLGEMPRLVGRSSYHICGNCSVHLSSVDFQLHGLPRPADRLGIGAYALAELAALFRHAQRDGKSTLLRCTGKLAHMC
jgi:hypothetical protein